MKATVSVTDLASTGMPAKVRGMAKVSFVARVWNKAVDTVATVSSHALLTAQVAKEKVAIAASQAHTHASDAGNKLLANVAEGLGAAKAQGLDAVKFANESLTKARDGIAARATSAKLVVIAKTGEYKARAIEVSYVVQQRALGYVPVGIKARMMSAQGYIIHRFSATRSVASGLIDSTRAHIATHASSLQATVNGIMDNGKAQAVNLVTRTCTIVDKHTPVPVKSAVTTVYDASSTRLSAVSSKATEIASDPKAKTAAAGAAGGAVAMGATGGAVGLASGSAIGAVVGLVPAIFTFGLSIPVGAVLGGSAGLCVGTAVGSTTGLVAGGAAGYHKDNISSSTAKALAQAKKTADVSQQVVRKQVASSATFLRTRVNMISGTGGTDTASSESD